MSNFNFIPAQWKQLAETPSEAEKHVYGAPLYCAMLCRKSLEEWVRWMYEHDPDLVLPYDTSLSSLIHDQGFQKIVAPVQFNQINLIRKQGNAAVHTTATMKPLEALHSLKLLYGFVVWLVQVYGEEKLEIPAFDVSLIEKESGKDKSKEELQKLEKEFHAQQDKLQKLEEELAAIKAIKEQNIAFIPPPIDPNEDLTRKIYIDTLLREVGWDPNGLNVLEFPLKNCMPKADGTLTDGFVDYVLWGDDGKPLGKFIRNIMGLDANAAKLAFGEVLINKTLNSQQIRFIDTIINFFTVNGSIDPALLFEPPFTDINSNGIAGLFDDETQVKIIQLIEKVNENAVA